MFEYAMKLRSIALWVAVAAVALGPTGPALAQNLGLEVRAGPGIHGLELASRDLLDPLYHGRLSDLSVELIYTPPVDLSLLGSPRLAVGGTFDFSGHEQMAHANLNWHVPVFATPFYLEAGLGAAVMVGYLHSPPPGYRALGCNTGFYFQAAAGVELPADFTATLAVEHTSHAWLCGADNDGVNSLGLKLGHKF